MNKKLPPVPDKYRTQYLQEGGGFFQKVWNGIKDSKNFFTHGERLNRLNQRLTDMQSNPGYETDPRFKRLTAKRDYIKTIAPTDYSAWNDYMVRSRQDKIISLDARRDSIKSNNPDNFESLRRYKKASKEIERLSGMTDKEYGNQIKQDRETRWNIFKNATSNVASGLSAAGNLATSAISSQMDISNDSSFNTAQQVGQGLSQLGPYGQLGATVLNGLNLGLEMAGKGTSQMNKATADAAGISTLGRIGANAAALFGIGEKTNQAMQKTAEAQAISGAYPDASTFIDTMAAAGGKRYGGGVGAVNDGINESNILAATMHEAGQTNTMRKQSDAALDFARRNDMVFNDLRLRSGIGKNGLKLPSISEIKYLLSLQDSADIQAFQNGGVIGIDVNVIPEGKYHAHKNHLDEISEEFEDLTKKGIPVVVHSEGGELEQVAEIEKMEIIFRLEVTEQLEKLYKDGSDEAMIEAGKLVAIEIMENTQDNSGEVLNG